MTTVTLNEGTPSEQIIAKAVQATSIEDSTGRKIVLKRPGVLAQFRIVEVAGESAKNRVYMGMILPLIFVSELDGEPVTLPTNKLQLEALIQRLDEHGVEAVMDGVTKHFGEPDPETEKAEIKK